MPSQQAQPKYPMHLPPKKVGGVAKSRAKASPNARRKRPGHDRHYQPACDADYDWSGPGWSSPGK